MDWLTGCKRQEHGSLAARSRLYGALSQLANRVSPAVVQILVVGYGPVSSNENRAAASLVARQHAVGSGVIVDPAGYIITNAHVVQGADRIVVVPPVFSSAWPRDQKALAQPNYRARVAI